MKALIIGGSGALSGELAKQLLEEHEVWTLTRGNRPLADGVHSLVCDRNDRRAFEETLLGTKMKWDAVFDCICMNREHAVDDIGVLEKVTDRLVVVSTDSVYDPGHKKIPQAEDGEFIEEDGLTEACSYGGNKRRMEHVFIDYMSSAGHKMRITIFRPGHIYGKGLKLGCYPECSRSDELVDMMKAGRHLPLVGLGTYIIQPIYVKDLAEVMIECVDNAKCFDEIFCIGGPERIENRTYYEILAGLLGVEVTFTEIPLQGYSAAHPEFAGHLCHRCYDLTKLKNTGIRLPYRTLREGLGEAISEKDSRL